METIAGMQRIQGRCVWMDKSEFESRYFDLVADAPGKTFLFYGNMTKDVTRWSKSAVEYFGLPGEIFGDSAREWISRIHPDDVEEYVEDLEGLLHGVTPYHNCEYRIKNAKGEYVWVNCRGYMTYTEDGKPFWFGGIVTNMGHQTKIDPVTNLWTVNQFRGELNRLLDAHAHGGILMIGLENFKRINAEYSYAVGDKVLAQIGEKLYDGLRHNCHLFRMDGANFAVIMQDAGVERVVEYKNYIQNFMKNLVVSGQPVHLRARTAAAFFPEDGEFLDQIQSNLFYALDHAKLTNSEDVVFYTQELFAQKKRMTRLQDSIRECAEDGCKGFRIVMQPIVDTKTEVCDAAEVLLRFTHPEFGVVSPADFIPILESSKDIIKVGKWVIDQSLQTLSAWREQIGHMPLKRLHINVSYMQFKDLSLVDYVVERLDAYKLPHDAIMLELTESCRVEHTTFLSDILQRFKDAGVLIALDDFGTGYASLTVLKDIPADMVKLDHTMTRSITEKPKDKALIEFIVTYCRKVGIDVCAEGVEKIEALMIMRNVDVECIQGYYYDKPLELDAFYRKYVK